MKSFEQFDRHVLAHGVRQFQRRFALRRSDVCRELNICRGTYHRIHRREIGSARLAEDLWIKIAVRTRELSGVTRDP